MSSKLRPIQKDNVFLNIAAELSHLSTCNRKNVGAVITREGRCVSWGFNGAPPGQPHCWDNWHGYLPEGSRTGEDEMWADDQADEHGCRNATHAEANALAFAARQGISTKGGTLYVTVSPCDVCARLLIAAGIIRVVYDEEYRDPRGVEILRAAGVSCG